jgi:serine/threonine-protein kinase
VLATAIIEKSPGLSLPKPPPLTLAPDPVAIVADGPGVAVYQLEAWMPEKIAIIKLQGFVRAEDGEILESIPGLVRVHLLDRCYLPPEAPPPGLLSWLGLAPAPRVQPRVVAELELHLKHKETDFQRLLDITVRIRPGEDAEPYDPKWRAYCDRLFCTLRGFLMGNA